MRRHGETKGFLMQIFYLNTLYRKKRGEYNLMHIKLAKVRARSNGRSVTKIIKFENEKKIYLK